MLLSGVSLGVWSATRGLDPREMLESGAMFWTKKGVVAVSKPEAMDTIAVDATPTPPTRRRVGTPKKSDPGVDRVTMPPPRRRGRSPKTSSNEDAAYVPDEDNIVEEGDEDVEEDWESAALAWGLITAGGLGMGSAGVYGAEVTAR